MRLLVVGVVAAATLPPFTGGERRTDTASIRRYDASMVLEEDGTLHLDERIVVTMPHGKRGIFRIFDTGDPRADFDGDGSFTIFDFLAFQTAFDLGCS